MNDIEKENKYIEFVEIADAKLKTKRFQVFTKGHELTAGKATFLGEIKWYGGWRRYCLFPSVNTLWDSICLGEIKRFLEKLMSDRARLKRELKNND